MDETALKAAPAPAPDTVDGREFLARVADYLVFEFQPVVDAVTGACYGLEALFRGHGPLGFASVHELFEEAHRRGVLHGLDSMLREEAMRQFGAAGLDDTVRLFVNLDPRSFKSPDYRAGETAEAARHAGLASSRICLELSERHEVEVGLDDILTLSDSYRRQSFLVGLDDFGTGYAGLKALYDVHPDIVKIDRFFVRHLAEDRRKKAFAEHIVSLAKTLGMTVVAEGIERLPELRICTEIGVNLLQGFYIARPAPLPAAWQPVYRPVIDGRPHRNHNEDLRFIEHEVTQIPAISHDANMTEVFEHFRRNKRSAFFPVVDDTGAPIGVVREEDLKDYTYSPFGKDLISNANFRKTLADFLRPCPTADLRDEAEAILAQYAFNENDIGIIVTDNLHYAGFITSDALIRIMNEKNLAMARDSNPLSKLPGNRRVLEYVAGAVADAGQAYLFAYLDFDNFKPFNDTYGFRQGDRAIVLFADLMRKRFEPQGGFLGHIGGDDFFLGIKGGDLDMHVDRLKNLQAAFRGDVETFYDAEARARGGIRSADRNGQERFFPMLSVSCAILHVPPGPRRQTVEELAELIARVKKAAKGRDDGLAVVCPI